MKLVGKPTVSKSPPSTRFHFMPGWTQHTYHFDAPFYIGKSNMFVGCVPSLLGGALSLRSFQNIARDATSFKRSDFHPQMGTRTKVTRPELGSVPISCFQVPESALTHLQKKVNWTTFSEKFMKQLQRRFFRNFPAFLIFREFPFKWVCHHHQQKI